MRQHILFLVAAVLMVACTPTEYKITGTIASVDNEGTTIFINERIDREWVSIDSAKIQNGAFAFQGVADSARVVYLSFESKGGERFRKPFVLENGKINIVINSLTQMTVSGTKQNELLSTYSTEKDAFYAKANDEFQKLTAEAEADSTKAEAVNLRMEEFQKEDVASDIEFATKNVNSIVGTFVFANAFHGMTVEQKEKIVSQMNDATKSVKRVQEIIAAIETEKKTAVGQMYTDFSLASPEGGILALSDLVGKTDYVLVDFWASWCGPCIRSFPELKAFYQKHKGSKLAIMGVSLDDSDENWRSAIDVYQLNWNHISDLKGWKSAGAALYAVNSIPATVLINKEGKIVGRNLTVVQMDKMLSE
jgi:peroxiredoxin